MSFECENYRLWRVYCTTCENYAPKVQEPVLHPGRVFTKDLKIGMVLRRHNVGNLCKLVIIIDKPGKIIVKSLQVETGYDLQECDMYLAKSGLQPFKVNGKWSEKAWCEEVK